MSKMYSLEYIESVPNLATRACGGTVVYPNVYWGFVRMILGGFAFLPHVSKVYSLQDMELVPNLANRACGGTAVFPNVYPWVLGGFAFYLICLKCIVQKI